MLLEFRIWVQPVLRAPCGLSAGQPQRGKLAAVREHGEDHLMVEEIVAAKSEAAVVTPRALGVGNQLVAGDTNRIPRLGLLDGGVFGALAMGLNGIDTVFRSPCA